MTIAGDRDSLNVTLDRLATSSSSRR